jgi:hypothetical protein
MNAQEWRIYKKLKMHCVWQEMAFKTFEEGFTIRHIYKKILR